MAAEPRSCEAFRDALLRGSGAAAEAEHAAHLESCADCRAVARGATLLGGAARAEGLVSPNLRAATLARLHAPAQPRLGRLVLGLAPLAAFSIVLFLFVLPALLGLVLTPVVGSALGAQVLAALLVHGTIPAIGGGLLLLQLGRPRPRAFAPTETP